MSPAHPQRVKGVPSVSSMSPACPTIKYTTKNQTHIWSCSQKCPTAYLTCAEHQCLRPPVDVSTLIPILKYNDIGIVDISTHFLLNKKVKRKEEYKRKHHNESEFEKYLLQGENIYRKNTTLYGKPPHFQVQAADAILFLLINAEPLGPTELLPVGKKWRFLDKNLWT